MTQEQFVNPKDGFTEKPENFKEPPSPFDIQKARVVKEKRDVEKSMESIHATMKGIYEKKQKQQLAPTKSLKKQYTNQIKSSQKYVSSLFQTLREEMEEYVQAEFQLDQIEEEMK